MLKNPNTLDLTEELDPTAIADEAYEPDDLDSELSIEVTETEISTIKSITTTKNPIIVPDNLDPNCTLYEYVKACKLDNKLIEIVLAEKKVPFSLKEDATQEIIIGWNQLYPKWQYEPSQIIAYAYKVAGNLCLAIKRTLSLPVKVPASAFRPKKDGTSYITPGLLAPTLDMGESAEWFDAEGYASNLHNNVNLQDIKELGLLSEEHDINLSAIFGEDSSVRKAIYEKFSIKMTKNQQFIMEHLLAGISYQDIMEHLNMSKIKFKNEIKNIHKIICKGNIQKLKLHIKEADAD